jgi:1-acyl-sn-glycerol-3-phosphate acyltransferase
VKTAEPIETSGTAEEILGLVQTLALELQPGRRGMGSSSLDSSLERDFGLDSLGRAELLTRLEKAFGVRLPEALLATAETPRDFLKAVLVGPVGVAGLSREIVAEPAAPAEPVPDRTRTLLEVLDWHVQRHPERRHVLYYPGDGEPEEMTFGDLDRRARQVAAGLRGLGVGPGKAVGIMLPTCLDYFAAFYGAQMAGAIPVPLYPPARKSQIEDHLRRQAGILTTSQAGVLLTFPEVLPLARLLRAQIPGLRKVVTVAELSGGLSGGLSGDAAALPEVKESDVAFLQFTSGSTGNPKGVTLTHANLLANLRSIGKAVEMGPDDVVVSWLPLYHDMGLIGSWMGSLYFGLPLVLMSPLTFLARPSRWLWAIHRHRGTLSPAPNFAYELCVRKVEEAEIDGLDLSSWRYALNGAEPVSPEAMRRFTERYTRYGFNPRAMAPVYGLAENSLALAFTPVGRGPVLDTVDRETFQKTGQAVPPVSAEQPNVLRFVSCGFPVPDHEIRIVDESGNEVGERQEGRLDFRGPSATSGYYRNPEATARLIRDAREGWIDSGDRAYIAGGEVYVTGRVKDIIIRAGRNLYPHELEEAVGEIPGIRKGCVAVFGASDPESGTERVVVLAETREQGEEALERLRQAIQEVAVDLLGTPADDVVLAPPHAVPKTSSGKIRRAASRDLYERGRIGRGGAAVWLQLVHLGWEGLTSRVSRRARRASDLLYAGWFWTVFALAALPVAVALLITPGPARRRRLARAVARGLAAMTGTTIRMTGLEHLAGGRDSRIVAANHASYLDAFVLTAALPPDVAFVAKRELAGNAFAGALLRRLGAVFVERFEAGQGEVETRKVAAAVASGDSLLIFPEGTFSRIPGLRPFRMGAFVAAARTGAAVVPVAIRGTRSKLRGDGWFPRRGGVEVEAGPPVRPDGEDWAAAVRLRDAVRAGILARCGEPDLT